jgi:hypothetical protein
LKNGLDTIHGTLALLEPAINFYKKLFGPVLDAGVRLSDNIWDENEKLDDSDRINLDMPFTEEEIHEVID